VEFKYRFLIFTIVLLSNTAHAMNGNLFDQGVHQHAQRCKKGKRIFSGATSDVQFVAQLKQTINHVDITKALDQVLFDRLSAQAPSNFSMLMNREIDRVSCYDVMQHNFGEPPMTSYAHYFPECLMVRDDEGAAVQVSMLEGHTAWVKCIKQLNDGRLVSGSDDGTIKVWDLDTKQVRCHASGA
jgi:hypothetical protein